MRGGGRFAGALAAALVACVALLAACGVTRGTTAAGKPTPPEVRACADLAGFEHAAHLPITGVQVPVTAVDYAVSRPWSADAYGLSEYHLCQSIATAGQEGAADALAQSLFSVGTWRAARQFPTDGRHFSACGPAAQSAATSTPGAAAPAGATPTVAAAAAPRCWSRPDGTYAQVDQIGRDGTLLSFRLLLATPPIVSAPAGPTTTRVCDPALYTTFSEQKSIIITDGIEIPIPAGTGRGTSVWGYQVSGKGYNMPYIVTAMCTTGGASILDFMKQALPRYNWTRGDDDLHWRIANAGGTVLYMTFAGLSTPSHWYIVLNYLPDAPPPVMPTPTPTGPDASCASVPGLSHAGPISLPSAQFPADMVAAPTTTIHGSVFTVVDYLACAPHFELTAQPQNGSGGEPLYSMFMEGNWGSAGNFPFDGTTLGNCDETAAGNYLTQWCWAQGTAHYVDIERVTEPGKGLVVFHLLYAYAP